MRSNEKFFAKISLMVMMLSCSAARAEDEMRLQDAIDATLIGSQSNRTNNLQENDQNAEQQEFANQQDLDEQQNLNDQQELNNQQDFDEQQNLNTQQAEEDAAEGDDNLAEFDEITAQDNADNFKTGQNMTSPQNDNMLRQEQNSFSQQFEQTNTQTEFDEGEQAPAAIAEIDDGTAAATVAGESMSDAEPAMGLVHWIGYVYKEKEAMVNVEIVAKNNPKFDIYQEVNRAKQKELVVRYYDTKLRQKLRRDIDASEFRSPVAYIRTRNGEKEGIVEVILTIRNEVEVKYFAKDGNLLLSFPIPSDYFGNNEVAADAVAQAIDVSSPLVVARAENADLPRSGRVLGYVFNREVFDNVNMDSLQALPDDTLSFNNATPGTDENLANSSSNELQDNNSNNSNEQQENTQQNFEQNEQDFEQNEQNFEQNEQNFEQNEQDFEQNEQDFEQNEQNFEQNEQDFEQNEQDFEQNEQNFEQNEQDFEQNAQISREQQAHGRWINSEIIFLHVGQDPANDFSVPADLSDGTTDKNNSPVEAKNTSVEAKNTAVSGGEIPASNSDEMGQVPQNNLGQLAQDNSENNNLQEALLEGESLLAPLHGTETIGQDSASEDIAASEAKAVRLVFRDAPLSEVLHAIRSETGTNFIFTPEIGSRKIFLNLSNVPWDEALRALLEVNNLAMAKIGDNLVRIDTLEAIETYKKQLQSLKIQEGRTQPTKVMIIKLSHAKAGKMQSMIKSLLAAVTKEDDRIKVETDERTNSLLIEALPEDLAKIRVLVDRLDYRAPQVKIASRVVEVLTGNALGFGISWTGPINYDQSRGLGFGSLLFPNFATAQYAIEAGGGVGGPGASFGVHFGSLNDSVALDLRLQLSETQNKVEVLQTNNVVVQDGKSASITTGTTDYFILPGSEGAGASLQTVSYDVSLDVTPQITADDSVEMQININSTDPRAGGAGATGSNNRTISTSLLKRSGETIAIGGLYTLNKSNSSTGVPFLSSIPILGALFKSYQGGESRRELIFMVTPTVIHSNNIDDEDSLGNQGNNINNNMSGNNQFQQENQFQQSNNNLNANNINVEDPSNEDWEGSDNQFDQLQQGQQQGNTQGFSQSNEQLNNEQLNNEQLNNEQLNNEQLNNENNNIDIDEDENIDQEQDTLTINQQQNLGNQF